MNETDKAHHGEHQHDVHREVTFHFTVNGEAKTWHHHRIDYDEVVKLAFPDEATGNEVRYSVTWKKPNGHEGSLRPGQAVDVVDKMIFHVRNTYKS